MEVGALHASANHGELDVHALRCALAVGVGAASISRPGAADDADANHRRHPAAVHSLSQPRADSDGLAAGICLSGVGGVADVEGIQRTAGVSRLSVKHGLVEVPHDL